MIIPTSFTTAIGDKFYDKEIDVYTVTDTVSADGQARRSGSSVISATFFGNVNFSRLDKVQEAYGITEKIDMTITTNYNLANNSIIGYRGRQYNVIRAIPFDSHYLLIAKEWSSKS